MKSIFLSLFLFVSVHAFDSLNLTMLEPSKESSIQQLKTIADVHVFIQDIEESIQNGNSISLYVLGVFYMQDHKTENGIFKADITKGIQNLTQAAKKGYGVASSYLALFYLKNNEPEAAIRQLRWTIVKTNKTPKKLKYNASLEFATIVLDYFSSDQSRLEEARDYLLISLKKEKSPVLEFLLANIYNKLGKNDKANFYLNSACTNNDASARIKNFCEHGTLIERVKSK